MKRVKRLDTIIDETAAAGRTAKRKSETRRREMVTQYTIRFGSRDPIPISCIADAVKALADPRWPRKGDALHKEAVRITDEALAGHCRATVAMEAFRKAAEDAGILGMPPGQKK
jgi:hypothetical protein